MLSAIDLSATIGRARVLHRVCLDVNPGEMVVLAGANGAGKTSLLRAFAGDLAARSGHVRLNGKPLYLWPLADRARLRAVLPQDGNVAFGFTALETVLFGRYPHSRGMPGAHDTGIARAALAEVDAAAYEAREVHTLSGGERSRVMLARALAQIWESDAAGPRYLLLDEPVANLDVCHQHLALSLARRWTRERGVGVLAVLHDLNLAAQYADRLAVMKAGRLAAEGAPGKVLTESLVEDCFAMRAIVMRHPRFSFPLVLPRPGAFP